MDESVEANVRDGTSATNMAAASSILGVIRKFIGGFVLSDEEKMQAGIDTNNFHEIHDARQVGGQPNSSETVQAKGRIG